MFVMDRSRVRAALVSWLVITALLSAGCAELRPTASPQGPHKLIGEWNGWISIVRLGNGPARMTVKDHGLFEGVLRLEEEDRPFRGAISVLTPRMMRYDASFGDGIATVTEDRGRATLKLVPDGGGGGATFVRAQ